MDIEIGKWQSRTLVCHQILFLINLPKGEGNMLKEKYQELLDLGVKLQAKNGDVREEGGKLHIKGTTTYQYEKNQLWDKIKTYK
jgi:hypothetical protein